MIIGKAKRKRILKCYYDTKYHYHHEINPTRQLDWLFAWFRCFGNFEMVYGPDTPEWEKERVELALIQNKWAAHKVVKNP